MNRQHVTLGGEEILVQGNLVRGTENQVQVLESFSNEITGHEISPVGAIVNRVEHVLQNGVANRRSTMLSNGRKNLPGHISIVFISRRSEKIKQALDGL